MFIYNIIAEIANFIHGTGMEYEIITDYLCCRDSKSLLSDEDELVNLINFDCVSQLSLFDDNNTIQSSATNLMNSENYLGLVELLSRLDNFVGQESYLYEEESDVFDPLNSNFLDSIILLPRVIQRINWSHSIDELSGNINSIIHNLYVIYIPDLSGYNIINHFIDIGYERSNSNEKFRIGGSPVSNKTKVNVLDNQESNINNMIFDISYENEDAFIDQIISIIEKSENLKINMLVFPELISNKRINDAIINKIKSLNLNYIKIIALPTYYDEKSFQNIGCVYSVDQKRVIISQSKTFSYIQYKNKSKEKLNKNIIIHILHIKDLGRVVFPICKDLLVDKYINLCKAVNASFIIVRSFSPGKYGYIYFQRIIKAYTSFECCGFWINACSYKMDDDDKRVFCIKAHSKDFSLNEKEGIISCRMDCDNCIEYFDTM